jgi:hypothetical protein
MSRFTALLLALALLGGAAYFGKDLIHLKHEGVVANAIIVDAKNEHRITFDTHDGIGERTSNSAILEFTPEGGRPVRFKAWFWSAQQVGDQVRVLYNADDPSDACVDSWFSWLLPAILGFIGGSCLLYGLGVTDSGPEVTSSTRWTLFRWFD